MPKEHLYSDAAPDVIGPYSHAVKAGNLLFLSGQIALEPKTMELVDATFRHEAKQVFANVEAVLKDAGCSLNDIVSLTAYLTDLNDFEQVNAVMSEMFQTPYPSRAAVGVASLPRGARLEVVAIAFATD